MTDHHRADVEEHLAVALADYPTRGPDLDHLATHAVRSGARIRRRRRGAAVIASVALIGAGSLGVAALSPGDRPTSVPLATTAPQVDRTPATGEYSTDPESEEVPRDPDGGTVLPEGSPVVYEAVRPAPDDRYPVDEVRFYAGAQAEDARPVLSWNPPDAFGEYDLADAPRTAEIDGDPAWVVREADTTTVVGPVRDGGFLTLTAPGLTEAELVDLAASIRRTRPADQ